MKKNFIYNVSYQILILLIPLITIPYVSRVLGVDGIGTYSYTYSIAYYFMMFAMLGLNNYGNRSIAKVRDNKEKLSRTFKEIYCMQIITSTLMVILYFIYLNLFNIEYKRIAVIQLIYVISCVFDINWFFFGIEKFKLTVTRNTIIKVLSLIFIFLFVKNENDLWIYTFILSSSVLASQLFLWPFVKRYINNVKIKFSDIGKHFIPCLKLFLPVVAVAIYKVMDKTMIGWFSNMSEVGFYENAEKIISVPNAIIAALGTVMLPRMSNLYAKNKEQESKKIIEKSINLMMFLAFAMTFGLICISKNFSILFFGLGFEKSGIIIILLSITVLFLSWGNVLRTQYLIPKEYDKIYIESAFLGAIVNLILNLIFIPKYQSIGACIGTIFAELSVMLYQTISIKNELPIKKYIKDIIPFFLKSLLMFIIIYPLNFTNLNSIMKISIQVVLACIICYILNYKYVNSLINIYKLVLKIRKKVQK